MLRKLGVLDFTLPRQQFLGGRLVISKLQVLPLSAKQNLRDGGPIDAQPLGHFPMRHPGLRSDPKHVSGSELGARNPFPPSVSISLSHLSIVLVKTPEAQVSGLNTDGPVAGVQNKLLYRPTIDSVRHNVGENGDGLPVDEHAELAVSSLIGAGGPVPTAVRGWLPRHEPGERFSLSEARGSHLPTTGKWIAVSEPTLVMRSTPLPAQDRAITVGDGAGHPRIVFGEAHL
jgi:hypothetical protein